MKLDVVVPNNNEEKFMELAKKLHFDSVIFLYKISNKEEIIGIKNKLKNNAKFGLLLNSKNIKDYKKDIRIIKAEENIRPIIEHNKDIIIYDLELTGKRDFIHHRNSGLNHVLATIAHTHNIKVAFNLNSLLNMENKNIFARISQNIRLCRKYKIPMVIGSFAATPYEMRNYYDLVSLFKILGMTTLEIKKSFENILL